MSEDRLADLTRQGLRCLGRGVSIVSLKWEGRRYAMTATAVEGLSLEPPSMLVCVNRSASLAAPLRGGADFCINLLGISHHGLPAQCCSPNEGEERFAIGSWTSAPSGVPWLEDAAARFLCAQARLVEFGTHLIVIGTVRDVLLSGEREPLIHAHGAYHRLAPVAAPCAAPSTQ